MGGVFIIENPIDHGDPQNLPNWYMHANHGSLWQHPAIVSLQADTKARVVDFDQCSAFDSDESHGYRKGTRLMYSRPLKNGLRDLHNRCCPGAPDHKHKLCLGRHADGSYKSAEAAAYPKKMNEKLVDVLSGWYTGRLKEAPVEEAKEAAGTSAQHAEQCGVCEEAEEAAAAAKPAAASTSLTLDAEQHDAVTTPAGTAMAIVAAAGSGKTHVVHQRVTHLVEVYNLQAPNILTLTFARDACKEVKGRFLRSPATAAVQVYTFSAYCKRLLERDGNATGLQILDASDTVRYQLMREAMEKVNSNLRNHQATEEDEKKVKRKLDDYDKSVALGTTNDGDRSLFAEYKRLRNNAGRTDLCELVVKAIDLLKREPQLLDGLRPSHLVIDEFQDCNAQMLELIKMLLGLTTSNNTNTGDTPVGITVVGDGDQGIYSFNGAAEDCFGELRKALTSRAESNTTLPVWKDAALSTNYRSTAEIVRASTAVVAPNREGKVEAVSKRGESGTPVSIVACKDAKSELDFIVSQLKRLKESKEARYRDCAILTRTNLIRQEVWSALQEAGIPIAHAAQSAQSMPALQPYMAVLRLMVNDKDDDAFLEVAERCIGLQVAFALRALLSDESDKRPLIKRCVDAPALGKWSQELRDMRNTLDMLGRHFFTSQRLTVDTLLIAMHKGLDGSKGADMKTRGGVLIPSEGSRGLKRLAEEINAQINGPGVRHRGDRKTALKDFLKNLDQESEWLHVDDKDCGGGGGEIGVTLSTVHKAKGREWSRVFVVGCNEGDGGSWRFDNDSDLVEERRVLHVAMTRAKDVLTLTYAKGKLKLCLVDDLEKLPKSTCVRTDAKRYVVVGGGGGGLLESGAMPPLPVVRRNPSASSSRGPSPVLVEEEEEDRAKKKGKKKRPREPEEEPEEAAPKAVSSKAKGKAKAPQPQQQPPPPQRPPLAERQIESAAGGDSVMSQIAALEREDEEKRRREAVEAEERKAKLARLKLQAAEEEAKKAAAARKAIAPMDVESDSEEDDDDGEEDEESESEESEEIEDSSDDEDDMPIGAKAMKRLRKANEVEQLDPTEEPWKFKGRRIKVWWAGDKKWFKGTVTNWDISTGRKTLIYRYKLEYEDGDTKWHELAEERENWELI